MMSENKIRRLTKLCIVLFIYVSIISIVSCNTDKKILSDTDEIEESDLITPIENWVNNGDIVGAEMLMILDGDTIVYEVAGSKDQERNLNWEKNTICRIRSMTKPIVGTAILMLYDQGKLTLQDKASQYLAAFDNDDCREITIEHLLKHTAGFQQPGYPGWAGDYDSLDEVIQLLGDIGPTYTPGTRFNYSDGGTSALAAIVTAVAEIPVEDFIQNSILDPLEMKDSFCLLTDNDVRRDRISCTYQLNSGNWQKYWDNNSPPQVSFFRGSGGVFSTVIDYSIFLSMWLNKGSWNGHQFLKPETVDLALTPSSESLDANYPFGLHWQIYDDPIFSHTGSDGTLGSVDPEKNLLVLYSTQSRGNETLYRMNSVINDVLSSH